MQETKSLFNLIEIFIKAKRGMSKMINKTEHCDREQLHDFYCEKK